MTNVTSIERPRRSFEDRTTLVCCLREEVLIECVLREKLDEAWKQTCEAFKLGPAGLKLVSQWKDEYDQLEGQLVTLRYQG